jgi:hypothetical protein
MTDPTEPRTGQQRPAGIVLGIVIALVIAVPIFYFGLRLFGL